MHAENHGVPIQTLLGYGPGVATDGSFGVVFKHAVKEDDTPKQLKSLVVDTLAATLDPELWQHMKGLINHSMALQVIEAMIELRQHVKLETDDQGGGVKSEREDAISAFTQSNIPVDHGEFCHGGEHNGK
jgi:hypothetical protein